MAIMRWDPFGELLSMQRDTDRLLRRFGLGSGGNDESALSWLPRIDVKAEGDDMVVYAELPGLERDDIDVEVTEGVLTIKGERTSDSEKEDEGYIIRERSYGSFHRSVALPEGIDPGSIHADYTDGVLEVRIPKAAEALTPKTHRVALGVGSKE